MNAIEMQAEAVLLACQAARERERLSLFEREAVASERQAALAARAVIRAECRAWQGMPTLAPARRVDWGAIALWAVAVGVCAATWVGVFTLVGRALDGAGWWR